MRGSCSSVDYALNQEQIIYFLLRLKQFGVGLGLTLTCERKEGSQKKNAIEACTEALQQIAEKVKEKVSSVIKHALHPNKSKSRRRRLLLISAATRL